ncbi:MAG: 50S ribosomal protein L10 [Candidatus Izimaplasma sp.]|nr:50S ribosomal protein L10 [Candidatus Izimaplasma bacterium]
MSKQAIAKKSEEVKVLMEKMQNVNSFVILDYSGLTVQQVSKLRRELTANGCEMKVIKNNITKRAAAAVGYTELADTLAGPNAVAFSYEDSVSAAKTVYEFAKANKALELKVGVVDGEYMDNEKIMKIATIPTREVLLTMIAAGIMQPIKEVAMAIHMHVENLEESSEE